MLTLPSLQTQPRELVRKQMEGARDTGRRALAVGMPYCVAKPLVSLGLTVICEVSSSYARSQIATASIA